MTTATTSATDAMARVQAAFETLAARLTPPGSNPAPVRQALCEMARTTAKALRSGFDLADVLREIAAPPASPTAAPPWEALLDLTVDEFMARPVALCIQLREAQDTLWLGARAAAPEWLASWVGPRDGAWAHRQLGTVPAEERTLRRLLQELDAKVLELRRAPEAYAGD